MKIGSLFDGSGTAPLAAAMCGMDVAWISEIEPYPCRVTAARFPGVPNHGDITRMRGDEIEPVDVIVGGSPCQDLSIAGAQKGLEGGSRSSLFFEMIRVIREMREATYGVYPTFVVWENVPGAFSSNGGEDFRAVLENFANLTWRSDPISIPRPDKWLPSGIIMENSFSIGWRTLDAQYWGVPQRRRRIYLVLDIGGWSAPEILFKRKGLRGHPPSSGEAGEGTAADAEGGAGGGSWAFKERARKPGGGKGFLPGYERAFTLSTNVDQSICYGIENSGRTHGIADTLDASYFKGPGARNGNEREIVSIPCKDRERKYIVRRLTPLECCRLQGFPDWWEDGAEGSDTARYKMWGNGMALPNILYVMEGIREVVGDAAD